MPKRAAPSDATSSQPKKAKSTLAKPSQPELATRQPAATTKKPKKVAVKKDLSLDIKSHEQALNKEYRNLKKAVRENWHDGYEEHCEIICEIIGLVNEWQGEVFRAAIAKGEQLGAACKALEVMDVWIQKMKSNELNTRTDWGDMDSFSDLSVEDAKGEEVFTGYPERIQIKLWRDTALKAIVKKDQATVDSIVELFKKNSDMAKESFRTEDQNLFKRTKGPFDDLLNLMKKDYGEDSAIFKEFKEEFCGTKNHDDNKHDGNINDDGDPVQDDWYADDAEMKNALKVFKELVCT